MKTVKEIQKSLLKKQETINKLYKEIDVLRSELCSTTPNGRITICDHSKTEDYLWEWDSGYGRQSNMIGKQCVYCGWKDLWNRGSFYDPKDLTA